MKHSRQLRPRGHKIDASERPQHSSNYIEENGNPHRILNRLRITKRSAVATWRRILSANSSNHRKTLLSHLLRPILLKRLVGAYRILNRHRTLRRIVMAMQRWIPPASYSNHKKTPPSPLLHVQIPF